MSAKSIRLGTRASPLARWQADWVAAALRQLGHEVTLVPITTSGDQQTGAPIHTLGGVGLFTKEIQKALLDHAIDLAVHSLKDLPTDPIPELTLAAVPRRESPADALVSREGVSLPDLPPGSRVGTSSLRRRAQLLNVRPDLTLVDVRGNVDTRLRKLDSGEYDALVLAEAGLTRLGLQGRITQVLPAETMLPAPGQGALALETRTDDAATRGAVAPLTDPPSLASVLAERELLRALAAGCLAPLGAWGRGALSGGLMLSAVVLSEDGRKRISAGAQGAAADPFALGQVVARELLEQGAAALISAARQ